MNKITPFLWFDDNAEEAMNFYVSVFKNACVINVSDQIVTFEIEGQRLVGLNGGPYFKFNEAISLYVDCNSQEEVDELWKKLTAGGGEGGQCGWLKDKYGVSWQVVPTALFELLNDPDPAKAQSVTKAMLQMKKIDINALKQIREQQ